MIFSKHRELWLVALRNVRRFPGRAIAVFVPLLVVMAFSSAMTFLKDGVTREALGSIRSFPDITVSRTLAGRNIPPGPELAKDLATLDNVEKIVPGTWSLEAILGDGSVSEDIQANQTEGDWDLGVYLKEPAYADQVSGAIHADLKNVKVITRDDFVFLVKQEYGQRSGVFQLMWQILLLTALLIAWAQTSSINLEMSKEIGVLKTIGWHTLDIIELKMLEILVIGLSGLFAGILCGIVYLYISAPFVKEYFLGWQRSYAGGAVPIYIEWTSLFLLFVIGIFPLCAATVFSAWRMGTVEPDSAIRSG